MDDRTPRSPISGRSPARIFPRPAGLILCAGLIAASHASAQPSAHAEDVKAIEQVLETFRTALVNKDKPTYMSLFFSDKPEDIGWQFVSEDVRLQDIRRTKPDAIKARQIPSNNFISLIDNAVASSTTKEEVFSNPRIETDGDAASLTFDYTFLSDGVKQNWGKEMWQLIRTEQGWKIFSVIYSVRDERSPAAE